jgi:hypothetical protein
MLRRDALAKEEGVRFVGEELRGQGDGAVGKAQEEDKSFFAFVGLVNVGFSSHFGASLNHGGSKVGEVPEGLYADHHARVISNHSGMARMLSVIT